MKAPTNTELVLISFLLSKKNFSSKHNGTMMWFFCTNLNCDLILKITSTGFSDLCVTKFIPGNSVSLNLPLQTEKEKVGQLEISDVFRCFPNKPSCNALLHKLNYLNWSYFEVGLRVIQPYNSRGSMQVQPRHFGGLQYIQQDFQIWLTGSHQISAAILTTLLMRLAQHVPDGSTSTWRIPDASSSSSSKILKELFKRKRKSILSLIHTNYAKVCILNAGHPTVCIGCTAGCTPHSGPPVSEKINRAALRAKSAIMCSRSMVDTVLTFSSWEPLQVSCCWWLRVFHLEVCSPIFAKKTWGSRFPKLQSAWSLFMSFV